MNCSKTDIRIKDFYIKILQMIGMLSDLINSTFHFYYHILAFVTIIFFTTIIIIKNNIH